MLFIWYLNLPGQLVFLLAKSDNPTQHLNLPFSHLPPIFIVAPGTHRCSIDVCEWKGKRLFHQVFIYLFNSNVDDLKAERQKIKQKRKKEKKKEIKIELRNEGWGRWGTERQ